MTESSSKQVADFALDILDVDKVGLDNNDRSILLMMIEKFGGGRLVWKPWQRRSAKMPGTLEDVYERIF